MSQFMPEAQDAKVLGGVRVQVMVQAPVPLLDYAAPEALGRKLGVGMAVTVPLGRRTTYGYIVSVHAEPFPMAAPLKDILGLDDNRPRLGQAIMELVLFAANYYGVHPGDVLGCALPAMARAETRTFTLTAQGAACLA